MKQRYDNYERGLIAKLSPRGREILSIFQEVERGESLQISELCPVIKSGLRLVIFCCLSGDGKTQKLQDHVVFPQRQIRAKFLRLTSDLYKVDPTIQGFVLIDDYEPRRVWQWQVSQHRLSEQCASIAGRIGLGLPPPWVAKPWSWVDKSSRCFCDALDSIKKPEHSLLIHRLVEHMKKHPNKKLVGKVKEVGIRRAAHYAIQGNVLETVLPGAVLLQTEIPWTTKDPLYGPFRQHALPIIHPFPEERR